MSLRFNHMPGPRVATPRLMDMAVALVRGINQAPMSRGRTAMAAKFARTGEKTA